MSTLNEAVILSTREIAEIKSVEISVITDKNNYILAGDMLAQVKRALSAIDTRRTELKAPVLAEGRRIDTAFKPILDAGKELQTKIENGMKKYALEEQRKKEEWIKEQREEEQKKMEAEKIRLLNVATSEEKSNAFVSEMALGMAQTIEEQQEKEALIPINAKVQTLGGETKMTAVKVWKFEVVAAAAVPREYCEPVDKLIREAVSKGIREISGVRIYEDAKFINR